MVASNNTRVFYNLTENVGFNIQNDSVSGCQNSSTETAAKITAYSLLIFFSLVGNSLIIACFVKNKELRTPVNYFILNMSISDLCTPVFALPRRLNWLIVGSSKWLVHGSIGSFLCKLLPFTEDVSTYVSKLSLVIIAVERFYSVVFALKSPLVTSKSCPRLIAFTWIISSVFSAHFLYTYRLIRTAKDEFMCLFRWDPVSHTAEAFKVQWIINFACFTVVPFILLTSLYTGIAVSLHRQKKSLQLANEVSKQRAKENRRIACMLVVVWVVFLASYAPYHVHVFMYYLAPQTDRPCSFQFTADFSQFTYTAINPLIYYVFSTNYRHGINRLFCFGRKVGPLDCVTQKRKKHNSYNSQDIVPSRVSQGCNEAIELDSL